MSKAEAQAQPEEVPAVDPSQLAAAPRGASLYVGDLDPVVREDQLIELFRPIGPLLGVRICRDIITQRSLGYAYINFQTPEDAEKALTTLNFTMLGSKPIRLMWQQRDPTLRYSGVGNIFVKNLAEGLDHRGLYQLFRDYGAIMSCKVMQDNTGKSLGYGFVHFKEEDAANKAIEQMNGKKVDAEGNEDKEAKKKEELMSPEEAKKFRRAQALYVAHFIRRNARIAALLANFTNVYIKQVLPDVDKDAIEKFFSKFGGITSACAKKDGKGRAFAFCNFKNHDDAVKAIENVHGKHIDGLTPDGEEIFVQRAQSRSERLFELRQKYMQRQALGNNLYVRNFDPDFTDENLRELFKEFGEISSCKIMTDGRGHSRGFGFISFGSAEQANHALREMNGRMLNGKPLVVNIAQRRDHRYSMLQVQFQQRIQALLQRLPVMPFIAGGGGGPRAPMLNAVKKQPPGRQRITRQQHHHSNMFPPLSSVGGSAGSSAPPPPQHPYTVPKSTSPAVKPQNTPPIAPATPPFGPMNEGELLRLPVEEQKVQLGERLFLKISEVSEENAPKITGMFLEMEPTEIIRLLKTPTELNGKIEEALCVLRAHQLKKEQGSS